MWGADISPVSPALSTMMHDTPRCHDYFQHPCWKVTVQYVRMWFKQNTAEYHLRLGHWHVKTVQSIVSWHLIYDLLKIKCIKMKGMWCWEIKKKPESSLLPLNKIDVNIRNCQFQKVTANVSKHKHTLCNIRHVSLCFWLFVQLTCISYTDMHFC